MQYYPWANICHVNHIPNIIISIITHIANILLYSILIIIFNVFLYIHIDIVKNIYDILNNPSCDILLVISYILMYCVS